MRDLANAPSDVFQRFDLPEFRSRFRVTWLSALPLRLRVCVYCGGGRGGGDGGGGGILATTKALKVQECPDKEKGPRGFLIVS